MPKSTPQSRKKNAIKQFGSVQSAAKALGFTRQYFYTLLNNGPSSLAQDRIKGRGYNPFTFKPLK